MSQKSSILQPANSVSQVLIPDANSCFVVMPFHPLYEAEYEREIKPAVEEAGLVCVRGDEIYTRASHRPRYLAFRSQSPNSS